MKTTPYTCVLGHTATVIASWHDDALAPADMERLRAHIPACAACQSWVAELTSLDVALRTQRVPEPSAHLWNDVQLGMERSRLRQYGARPVLQVGRVARAALAVAAVALIVLSFARILGSRANTTRPAAAATHTTTAPASTPTLQKLPPAALPVAGLALIWQPVTLPFSATDADAVGLALSANDGTTGYACYAHPQPAGAQPAIWVTHDLGVNWSLASHLPTQGKLSFAECDLSVDALDPAILAVAVSAQNDATFKSSVTLYTSTDSGASWTARSGIVQLDGLATVDGKSYAIWSQGSDYSNATPQRLAVSSDGMQSWQPVDGQFIARKLSVLQFWVRPGDGALLAEVGTQPAPGQPSVTPELWQSLNGGATWVQLSTPALASYSVAQPVAGQPWQICGYSYDANAADTNPNTLACSTDGGERWAARPALRIVYACTDPSCKTPTQVQAMDNLVISEDGALFSSAPYGPMKNGVIQTIRGFAMYRLPAGSSQWEALGPEPGNAVLYVPNPGNGVLWAYGGGTYPGSPLSGTLGHTSYGYGIYTAAYLHRDFGGG